MMRKIFVFIWIIILLLSVGFRQVTKDDKESARSTQTGFAQIFNGKDLTGWDGEPVFWSVEAGRIIARVSPEVRVKNHTYLIWQGPKVRDFELRVKLRSTRGNSGIDYRAEPVLTDGDGNQLKWTIQGYQSDIAKGWMGSLYNWGKPGAQPGQFVVVTGDETASKRIGFVADKQVLSDVGYYKPDDWNEFTIVARGSHILHRINDYLVVEFIDNSSDTRREGVIGLQVHTGPGPFLNEFKDISIRQFNTTFGQAKPLFNGKDLAGWIFSDAQTESAWVVEDDMLVNTGRTQGYICTKDDYTNYVLRFQYRRLGRRKGNVMLRLADSDQCIRLYGRGDDFNRIGATDFTLKVHKRRGSMPAFKKLPEKLWNECEIVLNKGQLKVKVNNVTRAIATECEQTSGKIGFEAGGSHVQYRNIVIIPILSD